MISFLREPNSGSLAGWLAGLVSVLAQRTGLAEMAGSSSTTSRRSQPPATTQCDWDLHIPSPSPAHHFVRGSSLACRSLEFPSPVGRRASCLVTPSDERTHHRRSGDAALAFAHLPRILFHSLAPDCRQTKVSSSSVIPCHPRQTVVVPSVVSGSRDRKLEAAQQSESLRGARPAPLPSRNLRIGRCS